MTLYSIELYGMAWPKWRVPKWLSCSAIAVRLGITITKKEKNITITHSGHAEVFNTYHYFPMWLQWAASSTTIVFVDM